jgi:hypothetical protein
LAGGKSQKADEAKEVVKRDGADIALDVLRDVMRNLLTVKDSFMYVVDEALGIQEIKQDLSEAYTQSKPLSL